MADKSSIEWTDATWNPVTGCAKVSAGCKHCYAERDWARLAANQATRYHGRAFTDVRCHYDVLELPLRWLKPRRVFTNSMSDIFHPAVEDSFIADVFGIMASARHHTFQVLTKRPKRMLEILKDGIFHEAIQESMALYTDDHFEWPLPNVWLGVSVEDQATANERIPLLLQTPAAVRWVSAEPLIGPINLHAVINPGWDAAVVGERLARIDWIVVGGESGPKARPMHPDWPRILRDQCASAGVPFLFKQWGEWTEEDPGETAHKDCAGVTPSGDVALCSNGYQPPWDTMERLSASRGVRLDGRTLMFNVGKKRAGRLLDGVHHDAYPEPA